jgi:rhamnose utilization protein RhaD (predicted bifunctional aldolase and dehydrogenase)
MDWHLQELVEISRFYGADASFVIAGGGNTSYKNKEKIWIKASGISLATIDETGFVSLSRERLQQISVKEYSTDSLLRENEVKADLHEAIVSPKELRPSVETSLHEVIDYSYVVHTHPTKVNGLMCSVQASEACKKMFGDKALFVEYTDPGYVLFKKVAEEIRKFTEQFGFVPQIIFLENHGVFVGANSTEEIKVMYDDIMVTIGAKLNHQLPGYETEELKSVIVDRIGTLHPGYADFKAIGIKSDLIDHFVKDEHTFSKACKSFTPDDIVYCKAHYLYIPIQSNEKEDLDKTVSMIADYQSCYGYLPKVIALQNRGVIGVEESLKSARNVLDVYENILKISFYSENFGGPKFLDDAQIAFIDNWEVENYRRKIAKS